MSNILLVTNIPTPYRMPLFNAVSHNLEARGHKLFVLFGSPQAAGRRWEVELEGHRFDFSFASGPALRLPGGDEPTFTYGGLHRHLKRLDPALVISNGFGPSTLNMWLRSFVDARPFAIWSGAMNDGPGWSARLRRSQRRLMLSRAAGCIAYGSAAKEYLVGLGHPAASVHVALNTIDTTYFSNLRKPPHSEPFTFIAVGDLKSTKRVDLILEAASVLRKRGSSGFRIEIIGDGAARTQLEQAGQRLRIDDIVRFHGFLPQNEVRLSLSNADCLLFSSELDVWGLVVNEAMAMGIPAISSVRAGVTRDLVLDGQTGFAVDFEDTTTVADRMEWFLLHRDDAVEMGERARAQLLSKASLAASSDAWANAVCALCR
jgi:glycosyltransferase involved in cell wall biosynthesis